MKSVDVGKRYLTNCSEEIYRLDKNEFNCLLFNNGTIAMCLGDAGAYSAKFIFLVNNLANGMEISGKVFLNYFE